MGRPKAPLIERHAATAKALEIIDREGLQGFNIRRLGDALGVNGASLYHHFADKDDILHEVRLLVMREGQVVPPSGGATWQQQLLTSTSRYRKALLRHPNTAPLMMHAGRQSGLALRERLAGKMVQEGVPPRYIYAIVNSAETLAFGSALQNPLQESPSEQLALNGRTDLPHLARATRAAPRTAERLFLLEVRSLLDGWSALIDREAGELALATPQSDEDESSLGPR